ncbi:PAS domain-containing sensor histidine kinase [Desulfomarina profundi]|uniref:histidine kinase n=1 Tax=Desulfomarina profundi TaxID=2772557 RepID=A0A8D5JL51_9BACT|nr:ATP-binding protein [Desulfomarina profundi]BCL60202.1 PAS domain-containing sensor histidine kinase [Desulfomarina profundi]
MIDLKSLAGKAEQAGSVNQILRTQLLWMLLLRVILYTFLLGISLIFQGDQFDVITLPQNILTLLLLFIYLTTIFSAFHLLVFQGNLRKFGIIQNLLDTFFASVLIFLSGSSNSIFTSVYFFPIISGGLILPRKGGLFAAAAASLQYGLLLILETQGLYPRYLLEFISFVPSAPLMILNHFAVHGLTFFLAALLSALFGLRLRSTEDALTESIQKYDQLTILYKQVFDNITTGILTLDRRNRITSANNAIKKITGHPPEKLIGEKLYSLFPDLDLSHPNLRNTINFVRSDGKKVRIGYSHMPIHDAGKMTDRRDNDHSKIITLQDISEIERLEKQVRQAEKLAAIGMMSASIAHDFHNPLTAISGSAQVLAHEFSSGGAGNRTNYELTKIILRESNRLIDTVRDFLRFSRPEHTDKKWVSLKNCLDEVLQVCRADPAWPSTCNIEITLDHTLDIWADEKQMFTVFNHLIHNALSFCPKGKEIITVTAEEIQETEEGEILEIRISDNGPGIPENRREQIFEPFYTSRTDGTGLGLAIVKQTVEIHKGTIAVSEAENGGALFTIRLPLPAQAE